MRCESCGIGMLYSPMCFIPSLLDITRPHGSKYSVSIKSNFSALNLANMASSSNWSKVKCFKDLSNQTSTTPGMKTTKSRHSHNERFVSILYNWMLKLQMISLSLYLKFRRSKQSGGWNSDWSNPGRRDSCRLLLPVSDRWFYNHQYKSVDS